MIVKSFVNESNVIGNKLEARILKNVGSYSIQYYVNDIFKAEAHFNESHSLPQIESHAKSWLNEVKSLNG